MREACDLILRDLDGAARGRSRARRRAPPHADDRPHARRARRADDLRPEAGALVRGARPRHRARAARARRRSRVGKLSGAVGTFAHLPPSIEARRLRAARARAGAGLVAGHPARPPRRAAVARSRSPRRRSRSSRSRSAVCRRPRSARSRSRSPRARRARRRCRTSATRSAASRSSGSRGWCAATPRGARERRALARARHLALVGRARHPARQLHRARSHAAPLHAHRRGHGRLSGAHAREPRALARRGVLRHRAARAGQRGVSREQAYEWVQRNAMRSFDEQRDFKALLLADADVTGVLPPRGDRAGVRSRRAVQARRPRSSIGCSREPAVGRLPRSVRRGVADARARVRHAQAVGVRSAGPAPSPTRCTRWATAASSDVRQGKYFELDCRRPTAAQARALAAEVADKLLANPVIESYRIESRRG